ncbi:MAG: hypothetical protein A3G05_02275 [Candidatus Zambryskibacteria bacterium RIFCSPLOWO2_12_FULL_45_14]|uniref:Addiction module toxin RelE n=2 Tax=Candidatus Zambryskiibacteriota TaxID=1817925 RepID=A0A1G2UNM0_9BACT|nr:MAG: hypothetical protein A3H60_01130 [Candidatus Zambryskibacteria bacterium RIFCSPLOWO2_02_FULL_44_12b]OHB14641.1 MAG: hypothetical protein A3G05_02275 [Candidatus Zambryskibacteria bacterium RIFCSPLOWO2_12_FULL_45_14]
MINIMQIILRPSFKKGYKKLSKRLQEKADQKLTIFVGEPFAKILNNHELHDEYAGCRSVNVTGDCRAIYYMKGSVAVFIRIGTHSELFGR